MKKTISKKFKERRDPLEREQARTASEYKRKKQEQRLDYDY